MFQRAEDVAACGCIGNLATLPGMPVFHLFLQVLLYFVSIGALLVLLGGVVTILVWTLLKLRRLAIRLLGGMIRE